MYEGVNALPGGIYRDLDQVVRPNLYYHYSTPVCAQRWLDVCEDPVYGHKDLVDRVDGALPSLVSALRADWDGPEEVTFMSLGPGDGVLDEHLLRGLAAGLRLKGYWGLDFSFDLLRRAAHRLGHAEGLQDGFPLRFICGDFTDLSVSPSLDRQTGSARLFSLTGFTLGNYPEADLLGSVGSLMQEKDYLLLDARLHAFGTFTSSSAMDPAHRQQLSGSYDLDSVRRFVFGPVEVATTATAEDVHIDIEVVQSITSVPHALNLVIFCSNLDSTLRLTGKPIRRDRLDLAVTTLYHHPDLQGWFTSVGLELVWQQEFRDVAFYLLKRG